jgi:hypothetical protein
MNQQTKLRNSPEADIIGMTATTLLNGTFDQLEKFFPKDALVVMIGPLHRSVLSFLTIMSMCCRLCCGGPDALFLSLTQGAAQRQLAGIKRVTLMRDSPYSEITVGLKMPTQISPLEKLDQSENW